LTAQLSRQTSTGLRVRLLAIILILIAPIAVFDAVGLNQVRTTRIRITQERAFELAQAGAARFQDTIDDAHTVLDLLSRVPQVINSSPETCASFLRDVAASHKWARAFALIGEDQKIACSTNPDAIGFDLTARPWFQAARRSGDFSVSDFLVNQVNGAPTSFASLFYRNGITGQMQALVAGLDLAWFDRLAAAIGEKQNALVLLTDRSGVILARYPLSPIPGNARVSKQLQTELSAPKESLFAGIDPDGKERLFGSVLLTGASAHVVVGFDRAVVLGLIDRYAVIAALIFGGVTLLGGFIVWVIGDRIFVRPMEELNGLLRTTLDTMDQGLIAINRRGRTSVMNLRVLDLLGLPREFAATRPHKDEILEYQRSQGEFSSEEEYAGVVKDIDQRQRGTYERQRPNGTVLEVRTVPTEDGGFVRTYSDVTARRAVEAALRREKDRAEAAARATAEFLANMSHELRTPLTAIIGVSDMLLNGPLSPDKQRHFMEMQRNAGRGLLSVINDILDFSKIEAGQLDLEIAPLSLTEIAESCIKLVSDQAQRKGLKLTAAVAQDVHEWVLGDATRLRQILLNLVANGVKFTHSGSVRLTIDSVPATQALRFAVTDTGIGIKANELGALFQRFAQADSSTTRRFGGTGLGLAISKRLVALMGGNIDVRSEPGRGSTFSFTIELPRSREAQSDSSTPLPPSRASYRLLLAEDNELNRQLIKAMLEQAGHEVVAVNDGAEAVRVVIRNTFDAILMDVQMPEMDGYAATRAIRNATRDTPALPIIALTANAASDESERCLEAGMNVHVPKPVNWPALFTTIDQIVLESRESQPNKAPLVVDRRDKPMVSRGSDIQDKAVLEELRRSIGDQNAANLLKLFIVEAGQRFLSQPMSPEAHESVVEEAHAFGGSAGMLGFEDLAEACSALQSEGLTGQAFDECLDRCRRARDAVLESVAGLVVDDEFTRPMQTTA
jgi:signal transduction histidine kinase/DNA-binding response OmpR family regulator